MKRPLSRTHTIAIYARTHIYNHMLSVWPENVCAYVVREIADGNRKCVSFFFSVCIRYRARHGWLITFGTSSQTQRHSNIRLDRIAVHTATTKSHEFGFIVCVAYFIMILIIVKSEFSPAHFPQCAHERYEAHNAHVALMAFLRTAYIQVVAN